MTEQTHENTSSTFENTSTPNFMYRLRQKKAAAAIVFGAATLSLAGCAGANAAPEHTATATHTETPKKQESGPTTAEQIKKLQIPAGLSTDQLGQTVLSRFSDWLMADSANAEAQYLKAAPTVGAGLEGKGAFAIAQAKKNAQIYAPALFGPDYKSNPQLATLANQFTNMNAAALEQVVGSPTTDSVNLETYSEQLNYVSTTPVSKNGDTETFTVAYTKHDNASMNNVGLTDEKAGVKDPDGESGTATFTVQTSGDSVFITSMTEIVY